MAEFGELVDARNNEFGKEKCPFCNKAEHDFPEKKNIDISQIKSIPGQLGCGDLSPKQEKGRYGRARHHMIPAHQCYTRLHRIASMGQSVGYDINGKQNGIPLPTVWNKYKVAGEMVNFGTIHDENIKNNIRSEAMRISGGQWHVGNHHYDIPEKEDATEDMGDEGELDHKPYDEVVLRQLLKIADKAVSINLCEADEQDKISPALDKLCNEIKAKLNNFKTNPKSSYPYYVSRWAMEFEG